MSLIYLCLFRLRLRYILLLAATVALFHWPCIFIEFYCLQPLFWLFFDYAIHSERSAIISIFFSRLLRLTRMIVNRYCFFVCSDGSHHAFGWQSLFHSTCLRFANDSHQRQESSIATNMHRCNKRQHAYTHRNCFIKAWTQQQNELNQNGPIEKPLFSLKVWISE